MSKPDWPVTYLGQLRLKKIGWVALIRLALILGAYSKQPPFASHIANIFFSSVLLETTNGLLCCLALLCSGSGHGLLHLL